MQMLNTITVGVKGQILSWWCSI